MNMAFTGDISGSECATKRKSVSKSVKVEVLKISSAWPPPKRRSVLDFMEEEFAGGDTIAR
jgi:hypothetical protein